MSKERLEDFREFIDFMYESLDIEDHQRFVAISESMIKDGWFKWIYRYAKEQAERVQNLESRLAFEQGVTSNLQSKNKRYREAINEIKKLIPIKYKNEIELSSALVSIAKTIKALEESE